MAEKNVLYQCEDCNLYFSSLDDVKMHRCTTKSSGGNNSILVTKQTAHEINAESQMKKRTVTQCHKCSIYFNDMELMSEHICQKPPAGTPSSGDEKESKVASCSTADIGMSWTRSSTLLLITKYKTYQEKIKKGLIKKKTLWEEIATGMKDEGYSYNHEQVSGRWKTLQRGYKSVKDNKKKSGTRRKRFEYESELDEIYSKDPAITPEVTACSTDSKISAEVPNDSEDGDDESSRLSTPTPSGSGTNPKKRKRTSTSTEVIDVMKNFIENQEKRRKEESERKEKMHHEKMDLMKKLIETMGAHH